MCVFFILNFNSSACFLCVIDLTMANIQGEICHHKQCSMYSNKMVFMVVEFCFCSVMLMF
jgi:hypothetical protein